jgi:hypothetical protein
MPRLWQIGAEENSLSHLLKTVLPVWHISPYIGQADVALTDLGPLWLLPLSLSSLAKPGCAALEHARHTGIRISS